jgi:tellurite methyltransferase
MTDAGVRPRGGAYVAWERSWRVADSSSRWLVPEADVRDIVPLLKARDVRLLLDLGCGLGRHSCLLAAEGFRVVGMDASSSGLRRSMNSTRAFEEANFLLADMKRLPFADKVFDYVLAWNVIYHGVKEEVAAAVQEIRRVIRDGGLYQATMLSKRHGRYGVGVEIGDGSYVRPGEGSDKAYPHYYCGGSDLLALHQGFEVISLRDVDHRPEHASRSRSFHWHVVFEKLG